MGPWNSRRTLFPFGALRRKETRGISQTRCPDVLPELISAALYLPADLEGLAAPLAPSHRGHPEMESEGHTPAISGGSLSLPDPRPCMVSAPSVPAVTTMEVLGSTSQTSRLRSWLGRPHDGALRGPRFWVSSASCCRGPQGGTTVPGPFCLTFCPMMPWGPISPRGPGSPWGTEKSGGEQ